MFDKNINDRISDWIKLRNDLNISSNPLQDVWEFWKQAPFIPYNKNVDPYYQYGWPTPWEIIVNNKYDDFTKVLMIGWTLKLTEKFQKSKIELKTFTDNAKAVQYHLVIVDDCWAINYNDNGPVTVETLPDSFLLENLVELETPR
jgi:hypothetical protein